MNVSEHQTAAEFYPERLAGLTTQLQRVLVRARRVAAAMVGLALVAAGCGFEVLRGVFPLWPVGLAVLAFLGVLLLSLNLRQVRTRLERLAALYTRASARLDGSQIQSGQMGEQFREPGHLYDRDLTILGPDSLFGMLATVRTGIGQRGLAHFLLSAAGRETTLARQEAIRELTGRNDLREQIHQLGVSEFQQVPATFFDQWLEEAPPEFPRWVQPALFVMSGLLALLTLCGVIHLLPWPAVRLNLLGVLAVQAAIALSVRRRAVPVLDSASHLANQMAMFSDGLGLLQRETFHAPRLQALQRIARERGDAVHLLHRVQQQFVIVEQRTKNFFLILSLLFSAGTHAAIAIAAWKRRHAAAMRDWLAAWGEFEALCALATFAYEHPGYVYPEILPEGTSAFEAMALAHPLLGVEAVGNDVALDERTRLLLISGSNMAGKSTLLRAIGLNAVLAAAGAPVRAAAMRVAPMQIGASLALTDSLTEGKSKFLAEVERLHAILRAAEGARGLPVLFLIDEIFSGTNSLDRRVAAEAVVQALVAQRAIGALSTHDLTLTGMAANPLLHAVNVHMASPDAGDPLGFDYRLKAGVNPSSNALAILRLIGIVVEA